METAKPNGKVFDRSLHCARLHKPARVGFHDPCHGLKAVVGVLSAHLDMFVWMITEVRSCGS